MWVANASSPACVCVSIEGICINIFLSFFLSFLPSHEEATTENDFVKIVPICERFLLSLICAFPCVNSIAINYLHRSDTSLPHSLVICFVVCKQERVSFVASDNIRAYSRVRNEQSTEEEDKEEKKKNFQALEIARDCYRYTRSMRALV